MTVQADHEYMDTGVLAEDAVPEPKPVSLDKAKAQDNKQEEEDVD